MNSIFDTVPLGEVASVRSGYPFKSSDMGKNGAPIIKIKNIVPPRVDINDVSCVPQSIVDNDDRIRRFLLSERDILLALTGYVGKIGRFPKTERKYYLNQRVGKVFLKNSNIADYDFLYYVLSQSTYTAQIISTASGSVQQNISGTQIEGFEIPLPSLAEQKAIASILSTLDDKIENNRRINETLENIAKTIFKSWFVDFDPVRAKVESRPTDLPSDISNLFPDELVDSELGQIPKGWSRQIKDTFTPRNERVGEREIPEFSCSNNGVFLRAEKYKKSLSSSLVKNKVARKGDFVFGLSRKILNFGLMKNAIGAFSPVYKIYSVPEGYQLSQYFYRYMLSKTSYYYQAVSASSREGQSISERQLFELLIPTAPQMLLEKFSEISDPISKKQELVNQESETLTNIRDTLLPKLISGEIRVPDAEKFLEETAI